MSIIPFHASLLTLVYFFLSLRVIRLRRQLGVGLGPGQDPRLLRAMRVHANFAEYVPLALLLLVMLELQAWPSLLLHALGALLVFGRCAHAFGVSQAQERFFFRVSGMAATFTVLLVAALLLPLQLSG
jgi:uncharacterized membrane protein YecN with MAPEG domain